MHSRIAPTPSGRLHIGNLYNFILTYWFVRSQNGKLSLRIDDSDVARTRDEYIQDILDVLNWLELDYDDGPRSLTNFKENFSQQKKFESYYSFLTSNSSRLFACQCSRKSFEYLPSYPGTCETLGLEFERGKYAIRLSLGSEYPIMWRKDDQPAYHLCSLKDDIDMEITDIIRGDDLEEASHLQQQIASTLDWNFKASIYHHKVITNQGKKLSKTQKDLGVREQFPTPKDVFYYLAPFLETGPFSSLKELSKREFNSSILLQR